MALLASRREPLTTPERGNVQTIEAYAAPHHLALLTFWSSNQDRSCVAGHPSDDTCSGVAKRAWDFTRINARDTG